ncbi:hypothetical protein CMUS01_11665 [Colletotrichum musicola]|uniref:Uncharacterized protein n=1 Tax=Colletotrichum musicola TaxID=2175873 RepID=A0A8H6JUM3_9PEZI|nr:hypothetical protein CMUS01_11665 [Colletotrichum musicola]
MHRYQQASQSPATTAWPVPSMRSVFEIPAALSPNPFRRLELAEELTIDAWSGQVYHYYQVSRYAESPYGKLEDDESQKVVPKSSSTLRTGVWARTLVWLVSCAFAQTKRRVEVAASTISTALDRRREELKSWWISRSSNRYLAPLVVFPVVVGVLLVLMLNLILFRMEVKAMKCGKHHQILGPVPRGGLLSPCLRRLSVRASQNGSQEMLDGLQGVVVRPAEGARGSEHGPLSSLSVTAGTIRELGPRQWQPRRWFTARSAL